MVYKLKMPHFQNTGKDPQQSAALQEKNNQSLSILYDTYAPALLGFISSLIPNEKMAEETLINTFIKIWNRMGDFNSTGAGFFSQVLKIGRQTALDILKNNEERDLNIINTKIDPAKYIGKEDTVFNLIYYKGYTLNETASILQIPIENVRTVLKTSFRNLTKKIKAV